MKHAVARALVVAAIAGAVAAPGAARAESCVPVPVGTTGITIEAGGQTVRVPSVSGVAACYQVPGTLGIPWVWTEPGGGFSVVITGGSATGGHVVLKYVTDGSSDEVRVPIPGSGGGSETCLVGVGTPARSDCAVKISPDNVPTVPPLPTTGPLPSAPPVPTKPPTPTAPPIPTRPPTPTAPPIDPTPYCPRPGTCVPQGGTIVPALINGVRDALRPYLEIVCIVVHRVDEDRRCDPQ